MVYVSDVYEGSRDLRASQIKPKWKKSLPHFDIPAGMDLKTWGCSLSQLYREHVVPRYTFELQAILFSMLSSKGIVEFSLA